MGTSRVKLKILGYDFIVTSDDSEEYILKTGEMVEQRISQIMKDSESMSISMAAVFAAMEFCDEGMKSKSAADNLRAQIRDYLDEAGKARNEAEEAKKKVRELSSENQSLKMRLAQRENRK